MIRHAAAVVTVLLLSPSWVTAQGAELTVNASSASVHKAPSTASPVIGQAARGTRLAVTRNVGDWVKVAWPSAADGVGYVRVSVGSVSNGAVSNGTASGAPLPSNPPAQRATVQSSPRVATTSAAVEPAQTGNRLPIRTTTPSSSGTTHSRRGCPYGWSVLWSRSDRARMVAQAGRRSLICRDTRYVEPIDIGTMLVNRFGPSVLVFVL